MTDDDTATTFLDRLADLRIVPVVVIDDADQAEPLGEALVSAGLPCAEVTFRTSAAEGALARLAGVAGLTVGAGTVTTPDQAARAHQAGADFIVSPGFSADLAAWAASAGLPFLPGVATPTEVMAAQAAGLDVLKFFPAEASGGVRTLSALGGPFPGIRFVPTGGIGPANLADYLALPYVVACGGSWMVERSLIANGDFAEIGRRVAATVEILSGEAVPA